MASAVRWYMDEHVPRAVTQGLQRRGIDVLTTQEAGMLGMADDQQLAFAISQGRVVFTQDDDFLALAAGAAHSGDATARLGWEEGNPIRMPL
jgi:predicted nuclease of predicted toxin-antitoxin system